MNDTRHPPRHDRFIDGDQPGAHYRLTVEHHSSGEDMLLLALKREHGEPRYDFFPGYMEK